MAKTSVAQPEQRTTRQRWALRGRQLWEEHANEIKFEDGTWLIPSQSDLTSVYEVVLGRRGESCECAAYAYQSGSCKHIYAASIARAKSSPCAGCGRRFRHRDLTEVLEDHESLTWFVGDLLCWSCQHDHGGIT